MSNMDENLIKLDGIFTKRCKYCNGSGTNLSSSGPIPCDNCDGTGNILGPDGEFLKLIMERFIEGLDEVLEKYINKKPFPGGESE